VSAQRGTMTPGARAWNTTWTGAPIRSRRVPTSSSGAFGEEGNLRITDRLGDLFTVGGFNAYPAEIERVLARHPLVADCAVVGVPDPRPGEVGRAYVVPGGRPQPGAAEELIAWARREMADYKVSRQVEFRAELPRSASGTALKGQLRAEH
jgi:acyl-CoA synthetase (AMP-forming)/AMP-acid ligase II